MRPSLPTACRCRPAFPTPTRFMLVASLNVPLRTAAFGLEDRWLFWPRARLYTDRLELTGWSLSGRYHRSLPLDRIGEVESIEGSLVLHLTDGSALRIEIDTPREWAAALRSHRDVRGQEGPPNGADTS